MEDRLNLILDQLKNKLDDPQWLSKAVVELADILTHQSSDIAQAQFEETKSALKYMDDPSVEKKMTNSEADKRAIVDTQNRQKELILQREGIIETIQAIKKRLDILSWEFRHG